MNHSLAAASVCAAALLVAACSGGGGSGNGDADALVKAGAALEAKLGAPGEKADMPGSDDPDVKAFNGQAEKGLTELGTAAMPVDGLNSYDRLCGSAAKITAAYVSAGIGSVGSGGLPMNDQAKVAKMTQNSQRYMDQLFTPLLYSAHCTAVHLPSIEKAVSDQDVKEKQAALAKVRGGAYSQASGLLQMAASDDIGADRRKKVLDLLARDAGNFATVFSQAQRQEFGQMVQQIGQAQPDAKYNY
jgi:hypothetical protein